jgi:hypothetical protein
MEIPVAEDAHKKLDELAHDAELPVEFLCKLVLEEFARNTGGRVYVGSWESGNKGRRFVVQWPFITGFQKVRGEDLPGARK